MSSTVRPSTLPGRVPGSRIPSRAWLMLTLGVGAQTAGTVFVNTPAFLIPLLHTERGLTLAEAGLIAAAPTVGMVLTLIAWGALVDRVGERWVISGGLALTAVAAVAAMTVDGYVALAVLLLLGGMASASTNSASGSLVVRWFPSARRGLAMGIRQMAVPLGVTIAAVTVPVAADGGGIPAALLVPAAVAALCAVACAVGIRAAPPTSANPAPVRVSAPVPDAASVPASAPSSAADSAPTPPTRPANPYRGSSFLWRIHAVSVLLVVPQFTVSTFGLVWLVTELSWQPLAAGILVGGAQFAGAIGRILVGVLSDRVGSRVRPLRWVALSAATVMLLLAASDAASWGVAAVVFVIATVVVVADNGLAFTSVAEMAGTAWSGRALGVQNTGQYVAASIVAPGVGALIGLVGYPLAFALVALFPVLAIPLVPAARAERDSL